MARRPKNGDASLFPASTVASIQPPEIGKRPHFPQRVLVIGLDCATPQFVFGPQRFDLPNLQRLAADGCWGLLRSCDPPITAPAWAVMMSGRDPGASVFLVTVGAQGEDHPMSFHGENAGGHRYPLSGHCFRACF